MSAEAAFNTKEPPGPVHELVGRIGPNAVLQLEAALREGLGQDALERVFGHARQLQLLEHRPEHMVNQQVVIALYSALFTELPKHAPAIAADAGRRTADYIYANRIPALVRRLLGALPNWLASGLLLQAISKNAWTFAGSGHVRVKTGHRHLIEIIDNPLIMPGCVWHTAVFQRLFERLVSTESRVRCVQSGPPSRFVIST